MGKKTTAPAPRETSVQKGQKAKPKGEKEKLKDRKVKRAEKEPPRSKSEGAEKDVSGLPGKSDDYSSNVSFESLDVCEGLKKAVRDMGFETLTAIQAKSIPRLLEGRDVMGCARTGCGKTLAFLMPALQGLYVAEFTPAMGLGAIVISPTRELCEQIHQVAAETGKYLPQKITLVYGGSNRKVEVERLQKGANVVVATPGRLLDHLQNTKGLLVKNLKFLVLDEADRLLAQGFEDELNAIIQLLPKTRQTALFSATQDAKISDLVRLSMRNPLLVEVKQQHTDATVAGLEQGYVMCKAEDRFALLFTFLKKHSNKKIMVFFSTCRSTKFHETVLHFCGMPISCIHGKKSQNARTLEFHDFSQKEVGTLLCTDVAARGLDIPDVDWIVQYDPPDDPKEYIHRVGRTARGADGKGKALLFLLPEEKKFLLHLKRTNVNCKEYAFGTNSLNKEIPKLFPKLVMNNYHLNSEAREAYRSYLAAYLAHSLKECFDVSKLDLQKVGESFGLEAPPFVELNASLKQGRNNRRKQRVF